MKKKDFDNRLQNDLFPEMPASFESGLKKTMEQAGVRSGKRPTATGVFAGAISLLAAAACLVIVLIGVMGGGRSDKSNAAAPGEATSTPQMAQPTPVPMDQPTPIPMAQPTPGEWKGDTKVIALSESFDFENREKYEALYQGILRYLQNKGETEPKELWLCAIKPRVAGNNAVDGYYVLARHAFDRNEGPELYCVQAFLPDTPLTGTRGRSSTASRRMATCFGPRRAAGRAPTTPFILWRTAILSLISATSSTARNP